MGRELERQNGQFWIAEKWLEISTPKFHHLYIFKKTRFSLNMKILGAKEMDFAPTVCRLSFKKNFKYFSWDPRRIVSYGLNVENKHSLKS